MNATGLDKELFAAAVNAMPADGLSASRRQAALRFADSGFPTMKDENWKYTNLSGAIDISNQWLRNRSGESAEAKAGTADSELLASFTDQIDAHWLIIRNGRIDVDALTRIAEDTAAGVKLVQLSISDQKIGLHVADPLSALNAALLQDGLHIQVTESFSLDKPIGILQLDDPSQQTTQVRIVIDMAASSAIDVVECNLSQTAGSQFSNSVTEVNLADGAKLNYTRLQIRSDGHVGVNRMVADLEQNARFAHSAFDFGGSLTRNDVVANIIGVNAEVELAGLYLGSDDQHIDNHTRIEHRVGPAVSHEEYRGILNGRARGVFNGQAVVLEGADGTDASQSNHNLLLSERAEVDTKPELEIYADDVKCSHGATVGQLDEAALFYLRSRGLAADEARHLMTRAFAAAVLDKVTVPGCREFIAAALDRHLSGVLESSHS